MLQLASLQQVFLVDLLASLPLSLLEELWASPEVKVGFGGDDVGETPKRRPSFCFESFEASCVGAAL